MKKFILSIAAAVCCVCAANAQTFGIGTQLAEATIGFGPTSLSVGYEQGIVDIAEDWNVGVGGAATVEFYSGSDIMLQALGNVHWTGLNDFDFYAGYMLGFGVYSYNHGSSDAGIRHNFSLGARYYFNETWAVTANFNRNFSVGATMKF